MAVKRAPVAVILAAGKGTRMRSDLPKPLVPVAGRPILVWLLDSLAAAGVGEAVVVVGHGADQVRAALGDRVRYAVQAEQRGMAHAVACAREAVGDAPELLVFVGDGPLIRPASVQALVARHRETAADVTILTARFPTSLPYARVLRDEAGKICRVVEERDATPEEAAARELLGSHYLFRAEALWAFLGQIQPHPVTGERYLTVILDLMIASGRRVESVLLPDWRELVGPNTPEERLWAEAVLAGGDPPLPERRP